MHKYNPQKATSILNCRYKSYLIGAMENPAKNDGGIGWRQNLIPELQKRGIYSFDPTREELQKVGMPTDELMAKLNGWQLSGNYEIFLEYMRKIWKGNTYIEEDKITGEPKIIRVMGDIDYVENSDFLIWSHDELDKPGGTICELIIAWYRGIPVYLITKMAKSKMNKSLLYFLLDSGYGQGRVFKSQDELLEFLDYKYKEKQCIKNK